MRLSIVMIVVLVWSSFDALAIKWLSWALQLQLAFEWNTVFGFELMWPCVLSVWISLVYMIRIADTGWSALSSISVWIVICIYAQAILDGTGFPMVFD
jgi:hypothetical protein